MNQLRYHRHTFGRADLADLHALLDFAAGHSDQDGTALADLVRERLDGGTVELRTGEWNWLSNWVGVYIGQIQAKVPKDVRKRIYRMSAFLDLITSILARDPCRTVEVSRPAETCELEPSGAVQGSLF